MLGSAPIIGNRVSQHNFAQTPSVHGERSTFNRSFNVKDTLYFDQLTPIFVDEILPGDSIDLRAKMFARLNTPKFPIMDNMRMDVEFFFVPNRLVWENWERFQGAQDNPGDSTDFTIPQVEMPAVTGALVSSMADHFGIPTGIPGLSVNALPFRAMIKIFNDWYRDQNLQNSRPFSTGDGPDDYNDYINIPYSNKAHDYFTSCLPWPQKGPAVEIPASGFLPVILKDAPTDPVVIRDHTTGNPFGSTGLSSFSDGTLVNDAGTTAGVIDPKDTLLAEVDSGLQITINNWRNAMQVQSILELDARGGTRYVESLRARWGVVSPDFRLQRAEFIGGGRVEISIHPIPQTSPTAGSNAMGSLAAFGTSLSGDSDVVTQKSFVEHGYVIGICRPRADLTYQQGLNRMWSRLTRFDFAEPKLQQIGEQAVLNKELVAAGPAMINPVTGDPFDEEVFGYQERYAEYKYKPSEIRGEFRSTYASSLDPWHLAQEFAPVTTSPLQPPPELNEDFIEQQTPIDRALTVTAAPDLLLDVWFKYTHARKLATRPTPAGIGRF